MKNRNTLASLMVIAAVAAGPAAAQDTASADTQAQGSETNFRLPSIEAVMSMREQLSLTENQIADLDELRAESVERRSLAQAEMAEMRSRLQAGQIQRSELMAFVEDRRAESGDLRSEHRSRIEGVLDATQLETLQLRQVRTRSFRRGRASVSRGGQAGVRSGQRSFRDGRNARGSRGMRARQGVRGDRSLRGARQGRDGFRRGR